MGDFSELQTGEISSRFGNGLLKLNPKYRAGLVKQRVTDTYTRTCIRIGCGSHLTLINYVLAQIFDQLRAVIPISLYLVLFRLVIFRRGIDDAGLVIMGLVLLVFGLMLFMEGLKLALVPLGELLGSQLPKKIPLWGVLIVAFVLGISVTLAEPAIGVLGTLSSMIEPTRAPYLFLLLNQWNLLLMLFVGLGVGFAAVLGILRFTRGWSLKPIIFVTCTLTIILTCVINWIDPRLPTVVGLAWDCGAVTTGPVTVPIILSVGIGVIAHKRSLNPTAELSPLSGFGIVTLASLYPIIAVEILAMIAFGMYPGDSILEKIGAGAGSNGTVPEEIPQYDQSPLRELVFGLRAIAPLVLLLLFILKVILREKLPRVILFADNAPESNTSESDAKSPQPELFVGNAVEISLRDAAKDLHSYAQSPDQLAHSTGSYMKFKDQEDDETIELVERNKAGGGEEDDGAENELLEIATSHETEDGVEGEGHFRSEADAEKMAQEDEQHSYETNLMLAEQSSRSGALPVRAGATQDIQEVGRFSRGKIFLVGVLCAQFGMILFNWGLTYGLSALGSSAGNILPGAFQELPGEEGTPVFGYTTGIIVVFAFGWILGFLATIAEPALNILGEKVAHLTGGAFSKNLLIYSVSVGVATGIVLGLIKIVFESVQLIYLILATYSVALFLTFFSSEDFVNVAWDSAGVTTGPVTVPFVLTLGLSLGQAVKASDGFGILTMASVGPIISVLTCGLWIRLWAKIRPKKV